MARGIEIPLVADVSRFVGPIDDAADAVDRVADAFDDAGDASQRAGDQTDDAMRQAGDSAEDAGERARRSWKDALDGLDDDSRRAGDSVGDNTRRGFDEAGEGAQNFREEADSTAREAAASFDGSAESIADAFQEVAANALAGFGPAGAAAGLAAAAGIGLAIAKLQEVADATNEAKEAGAEWAQEFNTASMQDRLDALRERFSDLASTIVDDRQWFELWQDDAVSALDAVVDAGERAGTSVADFVRVFNEADPSERLEGLSAYRAELERMRDAYNESNLAAADRLNVPEARAWGEKRDAVDQLIGVLDDEIRQQEVANEVEQATREALEGTAQAIAEKNELLAEEADANRAAAGAEFDLQDALDKTRELMEDSETSARDKRRALLELSEQITDTASAEEEATGKTRDYNRVIDDNIDQFYAAAEAAGYTREEAEKLARRYGLMPKTVATDVTDRQSARRVRERVEEIPTRVDTNVEVNASTYQANAAIEQARREQESRPIWLQVLAAVVNR